MCRARTLRNKQSHKSLARLAQSPIKRWPRWTSRAVPEPQIVGPACDRAVMPEPQCQSHNARATMPEPQIVGPACDRAVMPEPQIVGPACDRATMPEPQIVGPACDRATTPEPQIGGPAAPEPWIVAQTGPHPRPEP